MIWSFSWRSSLLLEQIAACEACVCESPGAMIGGNKARGSPSQTLRWREMDSNSRFNNSELKTKPFQHFFVDLWDKKWDKIPISTGVYDGQATT